jgi:nicotinate-nucleotide adenylyltransferase
LTWNDLTAVFGGRFDPPHQGHVEAVLGLFERPGVKQVLILPSPTPAHKPAVATPEQRLEMAKLAFAHPKLPIQLDLREFERASAGRPTYSFDTLSDMKREFGPSLAFVIGTDQLENLPQWHRFPDVLGLCHWIVLERKSAPHGGKTFSEWEASGLVARVSDHLWRFKAGGTTMTLVPTPAPALSSTAIREQIARTGEPPEAQLPPGVYAYLKNVGLYGSTPSPLNRIG